MFSHRLNIFSNEITSYQDQISEANEFLNKLVQEAKESKVNPEWLTGSINYFS